MAHEKDIKKGLEKHYKLYDHNENLIFVTPVLKNLKEKLLKLTGKELRDVNLASSAVYRFENYFIECKYL